MYKVLDLFAGIGGFSLGLERTGGFETVAFCELDEKAQLVLKKHWPGVPVYGDVKELTVERLKADGVVPTVIAGGFPCQDISSAGRGKGIIGERSGLWSEMFRLIRDVRPAWAIIENVSVLRSRGLALVLQNLSEIGYCAEWHCIPASAVGAPHRRDRIWIVADTNNGHIRQEGKICPGGNSTQPSGKDVADTKGFGVEGSRAIGEQVSQLQIGKEISRCHSSGSRASHWAIEPGVGRVANGVPNRVDRLKQLGNAVVPQIPQLIGEAILAAETIHKGNQ